MGQYSELIEQIRVASASEDAGELYRAIAEFDAYRSATQFGDLNQRIDTFLKEIEPIGPELKVFVAWLRDVMYRARSEAD